MKVTPLISDLCFKFEVTETASQTERDQYVKDLKSKGNGTARYEDMSTVAGIVYFLRADNSEQEAKFTNITVNSNVDFDGVGCVVSQLPAAGTMATKGDKIKLRLSYI